MVAMIVSSYLGVRIGRVGQDGANQGESQEGSDAEMYPAKGRWPHEQCNPLLRQGRSIGPRV